MALNTLIESLDQRRRALLDELDGLGPHVLTAKPAPDRWSILEIAEHLVAAERVILRDLPPWAELVDQPCGLKQRIAYGLVLVVLRFAIPVKVPSRRMQPTGQAELPALRAEWDAHLRWLRAYATEFDADGSRSAVFRHPVAGPITLVQALRLDHLHLDIHLHQIARLRQRFERVAPLS